MQNKNSSGKLHRNNDKMLLVALVNNGQKQVLSPKEIDPRILETYRTVSWSEESEFICKLSRLRLAIHKEAGYAQLSLLQHGNPVALGALAWLPGMAGNIRANMLRVRELCFETSSIPVPPPLAEPALLPWVAVFLSPLFVARAGKPQRENAVGIVAATNVALIEQVQRANGNN